MGAVAEALDQNNVGRRQLGDQFGQAGFGRTAQFMDQGEAVGRGDQNLGGSGPAVQPAVLAGLVDVEGTLRPRPVSTGISLVISVVLPDPLHPARPINFGGLTCVNAVQPMREAARMITAN